MPIIIVNRKLEIKPNLLFNILDVSRCVYKTSKKELIDFSEPTFVHDAYGSEMWNYCEAE
jgi:hypothetical protein